MKYKEFKKWAESKWLNEEISYGVYHSINLLIREMNNLGFWERRRVWQNIEIDIVEHVVIPINQEIRFKEIRDAKRK